MAGQCYGLDLGTGTVRILQDGAGTVLIEPNMIAIRKKTEISAFGQDAWIMYERTSGLVKIHRPMKNGVIAELHEMKLLLNLLLRKINCKNGFIRSNFFYFAVPSAITEVEKRAFFSLALSSDFKSRDLFIVEKPVAAALGEGVDVMQTPGVMVIDFGMDTVELSVIAMGGIVKSKLLQHGGSVLNQTIMNSVKDNYHLLIGDKTAEVLKIELGSAKTAVHSYKEVQGRDLRTGLPATAKVDSVYVCAPIQGVLEQTAEASRVMLAHMPPEIKRAIENNGVIVTGGGSSLSRMDEFLHDALNIQIKMSETPEESVVKGLGMIMTDPKLEQLAFSIKEAIFN